jgi:hypothetical protein
MILEEDNDDDNIYNLHEQDVKDTGMFNIKVVVPMELGIKKGYKPNHTYDAYFVPPSSTTCAGGLLPVLALEDPATLIACIHDSDSISHALNTYSESRVDRCLATQKRSAECTPKAMKGVQTEEI